MRSDLECIPGYFQDLVIVWSDIIPLVTWQGARDVGEVEKACRMVNVRISPLFV